MAKGKARTFGQDLMRGEHIVGGKKPNTAPGGGHGANSKYNRGRAVNTQDWVNKKTAEGDIDGGMSGGQSGTSIFDPVLCELVYRWFSPPGGLVLDPFAGGSVRGIVAAILGRNYLGYELRPEQVAANEAQAKEICGGPARPEWRTADSRTIDQEECAADFIFSCPPYADLEVYSDHPNDLSTLPYEKFVLAYREIIAKACDKLAQDRFACFVVGEVRGKGGGYYDFVGDTVQAFRDAGLEYYNEMILVTAVGSLPIRVGRQFEVGRKIGKTHQNVLVFAKGDPRAATKNIGAVEFGEAMPDPIDDAADSGG